MSTSFHGDDYLDELEEKVKRRDGHIKLLRLTLQHARDKLEIYRDHSDGAYHGGLEHTKLMGNIRTTFAVTEPKDD